jgi:hypothetical protein
MPRQKLSPKSKRAAKATSQARWRQKVTTQCSQGRLTGPFIASTFRSSQPQATQKDRGSKEGAAASSSIATAALAQPIIEEERTGTVEEDAPLFIDDEPERDSSACSRRSRRQSSSLAQSRISDFYRVSKTKSASPAKAGTSVRRLSRALSISAAVEANINREAFQEEAREGASARQESATPLEQLAQAEEEEFIDIDELLPEPIEEEDDC